MLYSHVVVHSNTGYILYYIINKVYMYQFSILHTLPRVSPVRGIHR
jgi:hypothetical protein